MKSNATSGFKLSLKFFGQKQKFEKGYDPIVTFRLAFTLRNSENSNNFSSAKVDISETLSKPWSNTAHSKHVNCQQNARD